MVKKTIQGVESTAELFSALGDKTRLQLVKRLCDSGPISIRELSEGLDISRQAITKHLRVMEECGLVSSEKQGRQQIFELDQRRFEIAKAYLESVSSRWDAAIERLKRHLNE